MTQTKLNPISTGGINKIKTVKPQNDGDQDVIDLFAQAEYDHRKELAEFMAVKRAEREAEEKELKIHMILDAAIYVSLLVLSMVAISMAWG